jgi:hypothetical protein
MVALLAIAAPAAPQSDSDPRIAADGEGRLIVSRLPAILDDEELKRHLDSGLTTSFVFQVRRQGPVEPGAARVDIRLELWDEVYLVTVIDGEGRLESSQLASAETLSEWWSDVEIVLSIPAAEGTSSGSQARVSLAVVPFSQAELVDTQRWLTESIGQAHGGTRVGRGSGGSRAVGALIATSMQRRAVRSMTWNLPVVRREEP